MKRKTMAQNEEAWREMKNKHGTKQANMAQNKESWHILKKHGTICYRI